jgi:hypothetical protein
MTHLLLYKLQGGLNKMNTIFGLGQGEISYLRNIGLRDDEIRYLAWLKKKEKIRFRRNFEYGKV